MHATPGRTNPHVPERPRLLSLPNGEKATPIFSRAEMDRRLATLRAWMEQTSVDACVFTSIHNVNYFADYVYCSFGRHYGLVVGHDTHTIVGANLDYGRPWRRSLADSIAYTDWHRDNFFVAVRSLCPGRGRIGIELDHVTCAARAKLEAVLPDTELVDAGEATMRMRMIKSAEERALIRDGAAIADIGGAAGVEVIAESVPEHEVALHATTAMTREIARRYPQAELMDTWTWFQSGINTDGAHNPVTARRIERGDVLSLNCFPMIAGYYHALERTLFLRSRTGRVARAVGGELQGAPQGHRAHSARRALHGHRSRAERDLCRARSARPPDVRIRPLLRHAVPLLRPRGGLEFREDVETVLVPGMVVSMEPMITVPEGLAGAGGYREHDMLIVTDRGAENLTRFPFGAEHNIVRA